MPRGDGTGPMGAGPMTGRAAGYCAGYAAPGFANPVAGRMGFGMRRGGGGRGGFGFRNRYYATGVPGRLAAPRFREWTADEEAEYLDNEIKALENELKAVRERRGKLDAKQE